MSDARHPLDAEAQALCHRLAGLTFPWDLTRSLELALLKTFCVPSISGLLHATGEFERRPRKRYDDTALMVAELLRHGPDSAIGAAVIARMNRIHGHYAISNDDYIYVLSTFVAEPIRWLDAYGWRPLTLPERQALFRFWRHVGGRMGIRDLPDSLEGLMAWNQRVEAEVFHTAPSNGLVADATLAMLLRDWPAPLHGVLAAGLRGLLDPAVTASLGWQPPPPWWRRVLRQALRARSRLSNPGQRLAPRRSPRFFSQRPTPTYGASFTLQQLGPPPLLARLNGEASDAAPPTDGPASASVDHP